MKRLLPAIFSFSLLACITSKDVVAQDFDYDMTFNQISASQAATDLTKKAGTNVNGVKEGVTQNGITLYVPSVSNNRWSTKTDLEVHTQIKGPANAKYLLMMESQVGLKKIAFQFAGPSATSAGKLAIKYGAQPPDVTGLDPETATALQEAWEGSLQEKISDEIMTDAPGVPVFFDVSDALDYSGEPTDTKYVRIYITSGNSSRIYRFVASTTNFTTLPLDFLSFTAKANGIGNSVSLNWRTANEVNTKEFVVERRTDVEDFKAIGAVASANTAGIHNYRFEDLAALSGPAYYRIKQVDNDGKFSYSAVQHVSLKAGLGLSVYPNPTVDVLNVSHGTAANASLKVFNSNGQTIINRKVENGSAATSINVSSLSSGVYFLVVNNNGEESTAKFIKK